MSDQMRRSRVFVKSFGCSSNIADGEQMAGCLSEAGFQMTDSANNADILIYNTCAVKTPTENRVFEILRKAAVSSDQRLIVAGCLPLINFARLKSEIKFDGVLGPSCGNSVVDAVRKVLNREKIVWLGENVKTKPCLELPRSAVNPVVSIVPVAYGCLGSCSYCCVVFARGRLRSCGINEVVARIKRDLSMGAREVWLTGQDMACYGRDIDVGLPDLLRSVCEIDGEFWVRVGMMTPNIALDILPALVDAFQNEHVFKFVHLPVQSGDNGVLKRMNRFYSVEDFRHVVDAFRNRIPDCTLATDVICGFPGESPEAFEQTLQLISEIEPDVVNVSKFFPRPRTTAEKMTPKVSASEIKERSRRMANLSKQISLSKNRKWTNWKGRILIDERGKQASTLIGRNYAYKPVVVGSPDQSLIGSFRNVEVTRSFQTYLSAEITDSRA